MDGLLRPPGDAVTASVAVLPDPSPPLGRSSVVPNLARQRRTRSWPVVYLTCDLALIFVAWLMATFGSLSAWGSLPPGGFSIAFALLTIALFHSRGHYVSRLQIHTLDELRSIFAATALAAICALAGAELLGSHGLANEAVRTWLLTAAYVAAGRFALAQWQRSERREGTGLRPTLIVGAGEVARITAERLLIQPELGLKPVGFLDKEPRPETAGHAGLPVLGASWDLELVLEERAIEHVVLAFSTAPHDVLIRIAAQCLERGIELSIVPRLFEKVTTWHTVDHIGGLPLMTVRPSNPKSWEFALKYALDRVSAATLLLLAAPVMLVTALAIRIRMGRPVLFRQSRVGRDGRSFEIIKFRSMEQVDGLDRVTPLGAFLRRYSLDELPQLLNVVKGEMSLIGPRPERPELVSDFELVVYRYAERHRVKSGITGWAQVHGIGRGDERFAADTLARRAEWDNYYIENWSLWLDVKILISTLRAVFQFSQREDGPAVSTK